MQHSYDTTWQICKRNEIHSLLKEYEGRTMPFKCRLPSACELEDSGAERSSAQISALGRSKIPNYVILCAMRRILTNAQDPTKNTIDGAEQTPPLCRRICETALLHSV